MIFKAGEGRVQGENTGGRLRQDEQQRGEQRMIDEPKYEASARRDELREWGKERVGGVKPSEKTAW